MLVLEWKERPFIEKVNSRCFCWFPAAILVHQNGAPIWRLHTKLYKGAWNVSANNSETVGHKDLRQIVYILVFYNISFSWLLPLDGFQFTFILRDGKNNLYTKHGSEFLIVRWKEGDRWAEAKGRSTDIWLSILTFWMFPARSLHQGREKRCFQAQGEL